MEFGVFGVPTKTNDNEKGRQFPKYLGYHYMLLVWSSGLAIIRVSQGPSNPQPLNCTQESPKP